MPGSSARLSMPYPLGSDPVRDGDDAIKALADRVDLVLTRGAGAFRQVGRVTCVGSGAVLATAPLLNFDATFAAAVGVTSQGIPRLQAMAINGNYVAYVQNLSATQLGMSVRRFDNAVIAAGTQIVVEFQAEVPW